MTEVETSPTTPKAVPKKDLGIRIHPFDPMNHDQVPEPLIYDYKKLERLAKQIFYPHKCRIAMVGDNFESIIDDILTVYCPIHRKSLPEEYLERCKYTSEWYLVDFEEEEELWGLFANQMPSGDISVSTNAKQPKSKADNHSNDHCTQNRSDVGVNVHECFCVPVKRRKADDGSDGCSPQIETDPMAVK